MFGWTQNSTYSLFESNEDRSWSFSLGERLGVAPWSLEVGQFGQKTRTPNKSHCHHFSAHPKYQFCVHFYRNVRPKGVFAHFCVFPLIVLFPCSSLGIFSRFRVTFTVFGEAAVFVGRVLRGAIGSRIFRSSDVRHRSETLSHIYLGHYIWDTEVRHCLTSIPVITCETIRVRWWTVFLYCPRTSFSPLHT